MAPDSPPPEAYRFGPFRLEPSERRLLREGAPITLTPKSFDLLLVLVENPGRLLEKEALLKRVWADAFVEEANLANNISLLRKTLGEGNGTADYIETIPRRGYRFLATVERIEPPTHASAAAARLVTRQQLKPLMWTIVAVVGLIAVGATVLEFRQSPLPVRTLRFSITPPLGTSLPAPGQPVGAAISLDGARVVFQVIRNGEQFIAVRSLDALQAEIVPGTEAGRFPFWSPDSREIAFFAGDKLKRTSVSGGGVQTISNGGVGFGGTWNRDGLIIFAPSLTEGLFLVPAAGGEPRPLTSLRAGERYHARPNFLPDGRRFLYFAAPDAVYLATVDNGSATRILKNDRVALFSPAGYLLFVRNGTLVAHRFDVNRGELLGPPIPIMEDLNTAGPRGAAGFSISDGGELAYAAAAPVRVTPTWMDRTGQRRGIVDLPFPSVGFMELSPDGTQLAMESRPGLDTAFDIWRFDLLQKHASQITFSAALDRRPIWSPDGRMLAFVSDRQQGPGIYRKPAAGDKPEELLLAAESRDEDALPRPSDWSLKGIVYERIIPETKMDLWMVPLAGDRKPYPLVREAGIQSDGRFSPDGEWLAYTSDQSGRPEVIVQSMSMPAVKYRISTAGGSLPRWRRDGKELFYLSADDMLTAAPIRVNATTIQPGVPIALFRTGLAAIPGSVRPFAVSPDGERFLINTANDTSTTRSIIVESNWQAALKR